MEYIFKTKDINDESTKQKVWKLYKSLGWPFDSENKDDRFGATAMEISRLTLRLWNEKFGFLTEREFDDVLSYFDYTIHFYLYDGKFVVTNETILLDGDAMATLLDEESVLDWLYEVYKELKEIDEED